MSEIRIVTAFFDIGRGQWDNWAKRTDEQYFYCFSRLAQMKNYMYIFTEPKYVNKVKEIRNFYGLLDKTEIIEVSDFFSPPYTFKTVAWYGKVSEVLKKDGFSSFPSDPSCPEYWSPEYIIVNYAKADFVDYVVKKYKHNQDTQLAWIDFGYVRDDSLLPQSRYWSYNFPNKINVFNIKELDNRSLIDIIKTNTVYFQGCHIVAKAKNWTAFSYDMFTSLSKLLEVDLVDDDQTGILMSYRRTPHAFHSHYIDTSKNGWFVIFKEFNYEQ